MHSSVSVAFTISGAISYSLLSHFPIYNGEFIIRLMSNSRLLVNSVDAPKKRQMPVLGHSDYYLKNQICSMDECFNIWNRSGRSVSAYLALKESMAHCWLSGLHWRKSPCLITINRSDGLKGIMKCCLNFQWNSNFIGTFYLTVSEFPLLYAVHN